MRKYCLVHNIKYLELACTIFGYEALISKQHKILSNKPTHKTLCRIPKYWNGAFTSSLCAYSYMIYVRYLNSSC